MHNEDDERKAAVVDGVLAAAVELGVPAAQVAVAWLLERARRSSTGVVPITGPRTTSQLESYLAAAAVDLGAEIFDRLDDISRIDLGQPYNQLATTRAVTLGGDAAAFRSHPIPTA